MSFREWLSPNGVHHLVDVGSSMCATCGRIHDQVDEMAETLASGIIDEAEGDLDLAIKIIDRAKSILDQRNKTHEIQYHIHSDYETSLKEEFIRSHLRGYVYDEDISRFGVTDYWTDGR